MNAVFADSFFYFALINRHDPAHARAVVHAELDDRRVVTSQWVLTEVADGLSAPKWRPIVRGLFDELERNANVRIEPCSDALFRSGFELYSSRPDKDWSLTDCISFLFMERNGISEALTGDHHFEQAGFVALLKGAP